jgi:hypothetical protein
VGKATNTSIRVAGILAIIQTEHLLNISSEHCHNTNLYSSLDGKNLEMQNFDRGNWPLRSMRSR